jgi:hypothetical protein
LGSGTGYLPREVVYRTNDQARGEIRSPVNVVSRIDVKLQPETELWPVGSGARKFVVTLTHGARDSTRGKVTLNVPKGWSAPAAQPFHFSREGERASFTFTLQPPPKLTAGSYEVFAVAEDDAGNRYAAGVSRSRTPTSGRVVTTGTPSRRSTRRASRCRTWRASDTSGAPRIAIPEALQTVGLKVELLDGKALDRTDLSSFRAIIVGPRAYETDPDLPGNNDNLLAFARKGGLVLVQYQQYAFFLNDYAPYPLTVGKPRTGDYDSLDDSAGISFGRRNRAARRPRPSDGRNGRGDSGSSRCLPSCFVPIASARVTGPGGSRNGASISPTRGIPSITRC